MISENFIAAILVLLLVSTAARPAEAEQYSWPVISVIEGNTVTADARTTLPDDLALIVVSVPNIDVPQSQPLAKCTREAIAAREAIKFTHWLVATSKNVMFHKPVWGHLGGQVFARISFDGLFLSDLLIEAGFAREYAGGPLQGWCGTSPAPVRGATI